MVVAVAILIALIGGYFVWKNYLSPDAQRRRELEKNYEKYTSAMKTFEETMRADTYGGKTPQETLSMFIDALKKGDVELASKYFMLDTNTKSPDYLTRNQIEGVLIKVKNEGELEKIIKVAISAEPDPQSAINSDYFVFSARDDKGILITDIDLRINKYSNTWKIESM